MSGNCKDGIAPIPVTNIKLIKIIPLADGPFLQFNLYKLYRHKDAAGHVRHFTLNTVVSLSL
jgi:hypothetical protein